MAKTDSKPEPSAPRKPRVNVFERRLQNPFGEPSAPIVLKDPSLVCRWFNGAVTADHVWRAKHKGWELVVPAMVEDMDQIGGYALAADGHITRGERGQEVLMAMPRTWREEIQLAKTRENLKNMGNPNRQKAEVVEAASRGLSAESAEFLDKHIVPVGQVNDQYERIQRVEPE